VIWQSYGENKKVQFFWTHSVCNIFGIRWCQPVLLALQWLWCISLYLMLVPVLKPLPQYMYWHLQQNTRFFLLYIGCGFGSMICILNDSRQAVHAVTKQYNLVLAKGRWCCAAGKITMGLAESNGRHWSTAFGQLWVPERNALIGTTFIF